MEDTVKKYELRSLIASDLGTVCKIVTAIGIRQFKDCFKVEDFKKGAKKGADIEKIGFGVVFDIAGIILANFSKAETDIQSFLASLTGMTLDDIRNLSLADYGEMIIDVVTKEEFKDFFGRVMKLLNR